MSTTQYFAITCVQVAAKRMYNSWKLSVPLGNSGQQAVCTAAEYKYLGLEHIFHSNLSNINWPQTLRNIAL
jgi:hypothetical protein